MFRRLSLFVVASLALFANAQFPTCAQCKWSMNALGLVTDSVGTVLQPASVKPLQGAAASRTMHACVKTRPTAMLQTIASGPPARAPTGRALTIMPLSCATKLVSPSRTARIHQPGSAVFLLSMSRPACKSLASKPPTKSRG
ncbi:hypothetical protein RSOLAG22IIIB_05971 [Rhizoctonia solani]|uniref:Uncharacterized protein n=1 Tax=Rhizoctonia solani TaxID=456999 RepID=A0A0K6GAV7_9AGAM|nr:hypothetical protein RSOLAG22IIIB_05971 [Rhizoctonia solani]